MTQLIATTATILLSITLVLLLVIGDFAPCISTWQQSQIGKLAKEYGLGPKLALWATLVHIARVGICTLRCNMMARVMPELLILTEWCWKTGHWENIT
jgi:hypothetical protein